MIYQMKSMRQTMELQPKLKALQGKYPGKDMESRQMLAKEQQNYILKLELILLQVCFL